jgi:hypothetical protein
VNSIVNQIKAKASELRKLIVRTAATPHAGIVGFDNRPTWDNWPDKGGSPFDNRPTWDNWSKK